MDLFVALRGGGRPATANMNDVDDGELAQDGVANSMHSFYLKLNKCRAAPGKLWIFGNSIFNIITFVNRKDAPPPPHFANDTGSFYFF